MNKLDKLDAPNNEALSSIEQIEDRSGLAATYPTARSEWDGVALMSGEARAQKQHEDQIRINMAIRKWFPIVGLLIPMPFVLLSVMLAVAASYLDMKQAGILLLPVFFAIALWGYLSFKSMQAVYRIFYTHSIKTTPYLIAHLILLGICFQGIFVFAQTLHNGWTIGDVLIVGGLVLAVSIILAGVTLFIWTTRKLASNVKIACLAILAAVLAGVQVTFALL